MRVPFASWRNTLSRLGFGRKRKAKPRTGTQFRRNSSFESLERREVLATLYWDTNGATAGLGGSGTWNTSTANWTADPTGASATQAWNNAAGNTAVFGGTGGAVTLGTGITASGLTFNSTGYTVASNTLTLNGSATVTVASGKSATISSTVAGTAGLAKAGPGTLTLSGTNTFGGLVDIADGVVSVGTFANQGSNSPLGTGLSGGSGVDINLQGGGTLKYTGATVSTNRRFDLDNSGGTINVTSATATLTLSGNFSGDARPFTKEGSGTLVLPENADLGSLLVDAGTLKSAADAGGNFLAGDVTIADGANLDLNGNDEAFGSLAGGGTVLTGGAEVRTSSAASTTWSGVISGAGAFIKEGTGTLTLSGNNTYTGNTTVSAGRLKLGGGTNLPSGSGKGNVIVSGTGILDLNGTDESVNGLSGNGVVDNLGTSESTLAIGGNNQTSTFSGVIKNTTDTLNITKSGSGTFTLSGDNTYSGATTVNGGILAAAGIGDSPIVEINDGATLRLVTGSGDLHNTANITITGGTLDIHGDGENTGTITLVGGQVIDSLASNANLKVVAVNSSGTSTFSALFDNALDPTLNVTSGTLTLTKSMVSAGNITKTGNGTLELYHTNSLDNLTVSDGTVKSTGTGATGNFLSGNLTVATGATLNLNGNGEEFGSLSGGGTIVMGDAGVHTDSNSSTIWSGVIEGTGGFTKSGTGALTVSGLNTYTGDTTISEGPLKLGGGGTNLPSGAGKGNVIVTGSGILDLNGTDETVNGLSGNGTSRSILKVGHNNQSSIFSGIIQNTTSPLALIKVGTGTLTLSGNNTYTGSTTVSNGELELHGSLASTVTEDGGDFIAPEIWYAVTLSGMTPGESSANSTGSLVLTDGPLYISAYDWHTNGT